MNKQKYIFMKNCITDNSDEISGFLKESNY